MPTRKQRRRREKSFRHDYEYVLIDDEGNEVAVPDDERREQTAGSDRAKAPAKAQKPQKARQPARAGRQVQPASGDAWDAARSSSRR